MKAPGAGDGARHAAYPLGQHQFRPERAQDLPPLDRHGIGHDDDETIAARGGDGRQPDAGVPGRRLNDHAVLRQEPARLRVVQHGARDTILDRTRRIHTFRFREERKPEPQLPLDMCQLNQRCIADQLIDRRIYLSHLLAPIL